MFRIITVMSLLLFSVPMYAQGAYPGLTVGQVNQIEKQLRFQGQGGAINLLKNMIAGDEYNAIFLGLQHNLKDAALPDNVAELMNDCFHPDAIVVESNCDQRTLDIINSLGAKGVDVDKVYQEAIESSGGYNFPWQTKFETSFIERGIPALAFDPAGDDQLQRNRAISDRSAPLLKNGKKLLFIYGAGHGGKDGKCGQDYTLSMMLEEMGFTVLDLNMVATGDISPLQAVVNRNPITVGNFGFLSTEGMNFPSVLLDASQETLLQLFGSMDRYDGVLFLP